MKRNRHNYENLAIYQRSLVIALEVMGFIDLVRPFRLAEQIADSAVSVPSNIAEGSERGTDKEFRIFQRFFK